jgi:hypothetical protein
MKKISFELILDTMALTTVRFFCQCCVVDHLGSELFAVTANYYVIHKKRIKQNFVIFC